MTDHRDRFVAATDSLVVAVTLWASNDPRSKDKPVARALDRVLALYDAERGDCPGEGCTMAERGQHGPCHDCARNPGRPDYYEPKGGDRA